MVFWSLLPSQHYTWAKDSGQTAVGFILVDEKSILTVEMRLRQWLISPQPLSRITLVFTQKAVGKGNQIYSCQIPTVTFGILWVPLLGGLVNILAENMIHTHTHTHSIHTPQTGVFGRLKSTTDLPFQSEKAILSFTPKVSLTNIGKNHFCNSLPKWIK